VCAHSPHSAIPDYAEIIKEPIDLLTIEKRIRQDNYYKSKAMLLADLLLMVNNCKTYNDEESAYWQCACSLEKYFGTLFADTPALTGKSY
jgi:histone acetyltransferase